MDGADSVEGASEAEVEDVVEPTAESPPIDMEPRVESTRGNFCLFDDGASRMCLRNVPVSCGLCLFVMRGAFNWKKLRLRARYGAVRAWKLLLLLPRMLRPNTRRISPERD